MRVRVVQRRYYKSVSNIRVSAERDLLQDRVATLKQNIQSSFPRHQSNMKQILNKLRYEKRKLKIINVHKNRKIKVLMLLQKTVCCTQRRWHYQGFIIPKTFKFEEIPEAQTRSAGLPVRHNPNQWGGNKTKIQNIPRESPWWRNISGLIQCSFVPVLSENISRKHQVGGLWPFLCQLYSFRQG